MRNCVAFLFAYQKQQTLEQRVDTRGSDNPAMYYFTCHLQVICSSHSSFWSALLQQYVNTTWSITLQACYKGKY